MTAPNVPPTPCEYCHGSRICPTCEGEGGFSIAAQEARQLVLFECPDCLGTCVCQKCAEADKVRRATQNGTHPLDSPPHEGQ